MNGICTTSTSQWLFWISCIRVLLMNAAFEAPCSERSENLRTGIARSHSPSYPVPVCPCLLLGKARCPEYGGRHYNAHISLPAWEKPAAAGPVYPPD